MSATRIERDSMGEVEVSADRYWGAQTQRSLEHFRIGEERFPRVFLRAYALVKKAAARSNLDLAALEPELAAAIEQAATEVSRGLHDEHFPLVVWQTGSGTQTNMNMNEVIAHLANRRLGLPVGAPPRVHPNDHVNRAQSTNDTFPTAMHVALALSLHELVLPELGELASTFELAAERYRGLIKSGRTHLMDATPISLGQEISGWAAQLRQSEQAVEQALVSLYELAAGGTAVGTGLNARPGFAEKMAENLARETGLPFVTAKNKFAALAAHDAVVGLSGALRRCAVALMKIANDVRWMASGPRTGLAEIHIPENEPGSSIMPGKVNPTQCEALTMVCCQVMGNDAAIGFAGSQGNFELNVYKPMMIHAALQSARLLGDAMRSFRIHCATGIRADEARLAFYLERSLMQVTALSPHIGYDAAARIAKKAQAEDKTLRQAALELGLLSEAELDRLLDPRLMIGP